LRQTPVLLYDAGCRLCRFAARMVVRLDRGRELAVLPLRHPAAAPLLEPLRPEERFSSWRLARPDGSLAGHGAGVVPLFETMRVTRPLARLASLLPAGILDRLYGLVARHRRALGRFVPDGPAVVVATDQMTATSRASDSTESGEPDACTTRRSQRTEAPGA
jgi:predicted DCC family thiol-disulfide oxidoreductase YuxK